MDAETRVRRAEEASEAGLDYDAFLILLERLDTDETLSYESVDDLKRIGFLYDLILAETKGMFPNWVADFDLEIILELSVLDPQLIENIYRDCPGIQATQALELAQDIVFLTLFYHQIADTEIQKIRQIIEKYPNKKALFSDKLAYRTLLLSYDRFVTYCYIDNYLLRFKLLLLSAAHSKAADIAVRAKSRNTKLLKSVNKLVDDEMARPVMGEKHQGYLNVTELIEGIYHMKLPPWEDDRWFELYPESDHDSNDEV